MEFVLLENLHDHLIVVVEMVSVVLLSEKIAQAVLLIVDQHRVVVMGCVSTL